MDLNRRSFQRRSQLLPRPASYPWKPHVLRPVFVFVATLIMLLVAIALELILHFNRPDGWPAPKHLNHILWTAVPSLFAAALLFFWADIDEGVKILQPYVDLHHGPASPDSSVLLNYNMRNRFFVWPSMIRNRHFLALLSNSICLVCMLFSPLASAYFYLDVPPPSFASTLSNVTSLDVLRTSSTADVSDVSAAAAYVSAANSYSVSPPAFVRFQNDSATWTSSRVAINGLTTRGIILSRTFCINSAVTCDPITTTLTGDSISGAATSSSPCSFTVPLSSAQTVNDGSLYGAASATCSNAPTDTIYSPVAFFAIDTQNNSVAAVCSSSIMFRRATATLNSTTSELIAVDDAVTLTNHEAPGIDLNSPPFNGQPYNAVFFNSATTGSPTLAYQNTIQSLLTRTMHLRYFNSATRDADNWANIATNIYSQFLGLAALSLYYDDSSPSTTTGTLRPTDPRLFVSPVVTHVLCVLLIVIALCGVLLHFFERRQARDVRLAAEPGTLAAAVSVAGRTELAHILDGKDSEKDMHTMLHGLQFGWQPMTGRVAVYEDGYYEPVLPVDPENFNSDKGSRLRRYKRLSAAFSIRNNNRESTDQTPMTPVKEYDEPLQYNNGSQNNNSKNSHEVNELRIQESPNLMSFSPNPKPNTQFDTLKNPPSPTKPNDGMDK